MPPWGAAAASLELGAHVTENPAEPGAEEARWKPQPCCMSWKQVAVDVTSKFWVIGSTLGVPDGSLLSSLKSSSRSNALLSVPGF